MDDPSDDQINNLDTVNSSSDDKQDSAHPIDDVPQVAEGLPNEAQFEEPVASPEVTGEEDASGDAPDGEPMDIDEQLKSVGRLKGE